MLDKLFDELKLTGRLPSPSGVGLAILEMTQAEDVTVEDVCGALQADPTLTGRVLQMANSAAYGGAEPATTLLAAAQRLGLRTVNSVALGFDLVSSNRQGSCEGFDYESFWMHSLAVASAAQVLARGEQLAPGEAFTCGLLQGMGRLTLASVHPVGYSEVLARTLGQGSAELAAAESEAFGANHRELGAAMLREWGLPESFAVALEAAGAGQDLSQVSNPTARALAEVIDGARDLARGMTIGNTADARKCAQVWSQLETRRNHLELEGQGFGNLWNRVLEDWSNWGAMLQFELPAVPTLAAIKAAAESRGAAAPAAKPAPAAELGATNKAPAQHVVVAARSLRVLVADDEATTRRLVSFHLSRAGHSVFQAENGKQALQAFMRHQPDLVITDWQMPELSGLELVRALRSSRAGEAVQIMVLTGREGDDQVVEALEAGADEYLVKPLNPKILVARVGAAQRLVRMREQINCDGLERERQMAQLAVLNRRMQSAALTDTLTELPNRRYAMERLEQAAAAARVSGNPLSVIMSDIDKFKSVNDAHGHDIGDVVLRETAAIMRRHTRKGEVVCRLGGEEFLVICTDSDLRAATACAERIRGAVEANHIKAGSFDRSITISLGVAEFDPANPSVDALLKQSDERVFEAKEGGRNQVRAGGQEKQLRRSA